MTTLMTHSNFSDHELSCREKNLLDIHGICTLEYFQSIKKSTYFLRLISKMEIETSVLLLNDQPLIPTSNMSNQMFEFDTDCGSSRTSIKTSGFLSTFSRDVSKWSGLTLNSNLFSFHSPRVMSHLIMFFFPI